MSWASRRWERGSILGEVRSSGRGIIRAASGSSSGQNLNLAPAGSQPRIVPRSDHPISRASISANALRVLYRLKDGGYQAFLVGGSVRDLLLGLRPKDFDIATNALPEEVKALFRNCRLIGRRFRLAHVYFGPEIIEVATFRAAHEWQPEERDEDEWRAAGDDPERLLDSRGRILRDNVYGTIEEDVWRREVNRRLATDYAELFGRIDMLVMLEVDGFEAVRANRLLQERKLAAANPGGTAIMDEAALDRFLMHYERLTRWQLEEMPGRADIVIGIGSDQRPK